MSKIPCHCEACHLHLSKPWIANIEPATQPRFENVDGCKHKLLLGDCNKWYFIQMEQCTSIHAGYHKFMDVEANTFRGKLIETVAHKIVMEIEMGKIEAINIDNGDAPDGYYLVEWVS